MRYTEDTIQYPPEEQKALLKYYQTYFGKREWKGSVLNCMTAF